MHFFQEDFLAFPFFKLSPWPQSLVHSFSLYFLTHFLLPGRLPGDRYHKLDQSGTVEGTPRQNLEDLGSLLS